MELFWNWLSESYQRLSLKSPKYFQIVQRIGEIAMFISGLPLLIQQAELQFGIHIFDSLPPVVNSTFIRVVFFCGLITKIIAKLPVLQHTSAPVISSSDKPIDKDKALPYSSNVTETKIK